MELRESVDSSDVQLEDGAGESGVVQVVEGDRERDESAELKDSVDLQESMPKAELEIEMKS